jgi:hypothetical protein
VTEKEWLECTEPTPMLKFLRGPESTVTRVLFGREIPFTEYHSRRISERKVRLFCCACLRRLWYLLDEQHCRRLVEYGQQAGSLEGLGLAEPPIDSCHRAIELVERSADEPVPPEEFQALAQAADALHFPANDYAAC